MATLAQLRSDLISQLGLLEIDQFIPEAELNKSVNIGLQRFSREYSWPHLRVFDTIAISKDDNQYTTPANYDYLVAASINDQPLQIASLGELPAYNNMSYMPSLITEQGAYLTLTPTPSEDSTLKITYARTEPTLSGDSDTPLAPNRYNDLIVLFAAEHQATRLKDAQLLDTIQRQIKKYMDKLAYEVMRSSQAARIDMRKDTGNGYAW